MIRAFLLLSPLIAAGCAPAGTYPSLARRPAERIIGSADATAPAAVSAQSSAPPRAELNARLAQLVEQARSAHQRFGERRAGAERLIGGASGAAVASESWSVANVALADLEAARSQAMIALGDLDEIYAAESVKGAGTADTDAARRAHEQVGAWVEEEDAVIARLRTRLR